MRAKRKYILLYLVGADVTKPLLTAAAAATAAVYK